MARFLFIWMIMIGSMVGIRDGAHFDVDLWPELPPRANALLRVVADLFVLVMALVFIWYGIRFVQFGWDQTSELAELPMAVDLHRLAARRLHLGRVPRRALPRQPARLIARPAKAASMSGGGALSPSMAALILFGVFFFLMAVRVPIAFALGLACLPVMLYRAAAVADDPLQRDLQVVQLVHPDGGAVLPAHRQPDERRRHHRPAGAAVARPGRPPARRPGAGQRRALDLLRRHLRARRPPTRRARARSSSRRRSRKATTCRSRSRSPPSRRCSR